MTCRELTELATDYVERRMPPWRRLAFAAHVWTCRPCRAYLEQLRQTVRALGRLAAEPPPPEVRDELLRRLRDWKSRPAPPA